MSKIILGLIFVTLFSPRLGFAAPAVLVEDSLTGCRLAVLSAQRGSEEIGSIYRDLFFGRII